MFGLTPYRKNQDLGRSKNDLWDLDSMFENFFNDSLFPAFYNNSNHMKVDVKENETEYIVEAELPGVNKEDVNIELNDNNLTISVSKNEQVNEERENYIRKERHQSSMTRSFYVENVNNEKVDAKFNNGLLSIVLPKKEPGNPKNKKIDIH
jgi:HSP20 family protein